MWHLNEDLTFIVLSHLVHKDKLYKLYNQENDEKIEKQQNGNSIYQNFFNFSLTCKDFNNYFHNYISQEYIYIDTLYNRKFWNLTFPYNFDLNHLKFNKTYHWYERDYSTLIVYYDFEHQVEYSISLLEDMFNEEIQIDKGSICYNFNKNDEINIKYIINKLLFNKEVLNKLLTMSKKSYNELKKKYNNIRINNWDNDLNREDPFEDLSLIEKAMLIIYRYTRKPSQNCPHLYDNNIVFHNERSFYESIRLFTIRLLIKQLKHHFNNPEFSEISEFFENSESSKNYKFNENSLLLEIRYNQLIEENLFWNINDILSLDFQIEFRETIRSTKSIVTGSSVLERLLSENYENSDIDIYTLNEYYSEWIHFFINNGGIIKKVYKSFSRYDQIVDSYEELEMPIQYITNIEAHGQLFQIISLDSKVIHEIFNNNLNDNLNNLNDIPEKLSRLVYEKFDLSFCSYCWDGYNILQNGEKILEIYELQESYKNLNKATLKTGTFNINNNIDIYRIAKYTQRGFNISVNNLYYGCGYESTNETINETIDEND